MSHTAPDWRDLITAEDQAKINELDEAAKRSREQHSLPEGGFLLKNLYYDRVGAPLSFGEISILRHRPDYCVVARTRIGPYTVSTAWIGIDHGPGYYEDDSPPIVFETTVSSADDWDDPEVGLAQFDVERYSTNQQAVDGHDQMVTMVRATCQTELGEDPEVVREKGAPE